MDPGAGPALGAGDPGPAPLWPGFRVPLLPHQNQPPERPWSLGEIPVTQSQPGPTGAAPLFRLQMSWCPGHCAWGGGDPLLGPWPAALVLANLRTDGEAASSLCLMGPSLAVPGRGCPRRLRQRKMCWVLWSTDGMGDRGMPKPALQPSRASVLETPLAVGQLGSPHLLGPKSWRDPHPRQAGKSHHHIACVWGGPLGRPVELFS